MAVAVKREPQALERSRSPRHAEAEGAALVSEHDPHEQGLRNRTAVTLRKNNDPLTGKAVKVKDVHAVFEPDRRGIAEVLYVDLDDQPQTAFLLGDDLVYVAGGW